MQDQNSFKLKMGFLIVWDDKILAPTIKIISMSNTILKKKTRPLLFKLLHNKIID